MTAPSTGPAGLLHVHRSWLAPIAIAAVVLSVLAAAAPIERPRTFQPLRGDPTTGSLYFIGNSMFGTGLDIDAVRDSLPHETASLGYYDGHYTSTWYAAFRNSLIPSGIRPKVVVWGFRPTYAVLPAFRQNAETELDLLHDPDDPVFRAILANAEAVDNPANRSVVVPRRKQSILDWLSDAAPIVKRRSDFRRLYSDVAAHVVARAYAKTNDIAAQFSDPRSSLKISDIIVSFATGGTIRRADALVVDNGERFIQGREMPFDQSFVPLTAQLLMDAEIPQIVIIFKPVSVLDGKMPASAWTYYKDVIAYFERERIPYLDFVADPLLTRDLYAKGDHYTQEGMTYVTNRIVENLRAEGFVE